MSLPSGRKPYPMLNMRPSPKRVLLGSSSGEVSGCFPSECSGKIAWRTRKLAACSATTAAAAASRAFEEPRAFTPRKRISEKGGGQHEVEAREEHQLERPAETVEIG